MPMFNSRPPRTPHYVITTRCHALTLEAETQVIDTWSTTSDDEPGEVLFIGPHGQCLHYKDLLESLEP